MRETADVAKFSVTRAHFKKLATDAKEKINGRCPPETRPDGVERVQRGATIHTKSDPELATNPEVRVALVARSALKRVEEGLGIWQVATMCGGL